MPKKNKTFRVIAWVGAIVVVLYVVGFYRFFVSPTGFRWRALYGDAKYPKGYEIRGIDISHYQGHIDWELLRTSHVEDAPIRFVVVKATEGGTSVDEMFQENFTEALEHGFTRGAYHFWSTKSSPTVQADFYIENVRLEAGDLAPVLDVERKDRRQSVEDFQADVLTWLRLVEEHYGVTPILYTFRKFKEQYLSAEAFDRYPYWVAHYYVDTIDESEVGEWKFWQHTDVGRLPGIKGYVDLDVYNGSFYDLKKLCLEQGENED